MDMKSSNTRNWEGVDGDDTWGATSSPPTQLGQAAGKFCLNGLGTPLEHKVSGYRSGTGWAASAGHNAGWPSN